jgi:hypothetical protein
MSSTGAESLIAKWSFRRIMRAPRAPQNAPDRPSRYLKVSCFHLSQCAP